MAYVRKASSKQVCSQQLDHGLFTFIVLTWICLMKQAVAASVTKNITVNIGVVLDIETIFGRKSFSCLSMALDDFYSAHVGFQTRISVHVRDSKQDVVSAASAALDLIKNGQVKAIIGPGTSMQAHFMLNLGDKAHVPIISFSATSPALSPLRNPYFFRATQNDSAQVKALGSLIKYFNWREVVPIYVQNEYGESIIPYLTDALQEVDCRVPYRSAIAPEATDIEIREELYKLMTMETRVFIVHMLPGLGSRVFKNAKQIGMMKDGFVWILTNGIGDMLNILNSTNLESMQGVLGIRNYVPRSKELEDFRIRWKRKFQSDNSDILSAELDIFGIWAHDAAMALAMAVEKVFNNKSEAFNFQSNNITGNLTDLETFGVSNAGPKLREALLASSFKGLAGNFYFINGEVPPYAYQIINSDENGGREVGYWSSEGGLSRFLNFNITGTESKPTLGPIIWPGESKLVPKGWNLPVNGKKLRVGVPVKDGFLDFVRITRDPVTNATTKVSGYCIDVFEAVIQAMPYAVEYEYIPFALPNGTSSGSYNDLTYQVYLGEFDAVVGDVTIVANRSLYVDFTLPYTESGVSMIVPIKDHVSKNAWVFLKPLTWELWFTSFCFFVFIGFVVWVLEHRTNKDFRGPPLHQVGVMLWFSFSTMVFAHKEKVVSNLARFVVIVWVFVVLILIQTYTASLTSMLTVQKLQPTVTDVNTLIKNGDTVGYQQGSFVLGLLKQLKFDESKLIQYKSVEALEESFSKGSANGGVSAVFDEIPYMKLFLGKHCSEYAMVGPTYKTDGFGFVFPKLSPLAPDVSRAILNVTQGEQMVAIENKWFGQHATCPDGSNTSLTPTNIGLDSFWGLFLIAGVASVSSLIIYLAIFLYQHKKAMPADETISWWTKLVLMLRQFDHKDLSSHTFKKARVRDIDTNHMSSIEMSHHHPMGSPSQTVYSDHQVATSSDHSGHSPSRSGQSSPNVWITVVDLADDPSSPTSSPTPHDHI